MSINVYWSCLEDQWMIAKEPESVSKIFYNKEFFNKKIKSSDVSHCPSFNENLKNLFAIKSIFNYSFFIENEKVFSNNFDQIFFDNHIKIRDLKNKMFSFKNSYIFFTDIDSLEATFYEYPIFENNNITKRCILVPGKYDIGKWFRSTEFAFYLKPEFNEFLINQEEIYSYVRFHTKEKINFIQFRFNKKLNKYQEDGFYLNNFINSSNNMFKFYKNMKNKKLILKEIKKNIL